MGVWVRMRGVGRRRLEEAKGKSGGGGGYIRNVFLVWVLSRALEVV